MRRWLIVTFLLLFILPCSAREIAGLVYSDSTYTILRGVECKVYEGNNEIARTVSDDSGVFWLSTDNTAALTLELDKEGFSGTVIIIEAGKDDADLGQIALSPASVLAELKVENSEIVHAYGRTIVYPSKYDVESTSTLLDLFQRLPLAGLSVDPLNRTMTVRGDAPLYIINGVPSSLDDVRNLKSKDIAKIEYSQVPPPQYAGYGMVGFISITLKERADGGRVNLYGRSAVNTAFVDGNLSASYHQGASQFTLQYNPSWRNYQDVYDHKSMQYIGNDYKVNIEQHDRDPFNYHTHGIALKYNFVPSDRTLFSATFNATPFSRKNRTIGQSHDDVLGDYDIFNINKNKSFSPSLDLFARHRFNSKNLLEAQVVGTLNSSVYRRDNQYQTTDGDVLQYINDINNRRRSLITALSYVHEFDGTTSLSAGLRNTLSHNTNDYLTTDYKPVQTENNNYLYASFAKQFSKVYLMATTGAQLFWLHNDNVRRHFIRNESNAYVQWYINQQWNVQGQFAYRAGIPSLGSVTDYMQQVSPYLWNNGNPNLKSSETLSYYVGVNFQKQKFTMNFNTTYMNDLNSVFNDVVYMGNKMFLQQMVNSKQAMVVYSNLQLSLRNIYGFGASVTLSYRYQHNEIGSTKYHLSSLSGDMSLWWAKDRWTISYRRVLPGKMLSGYVVSKGENQDLLGVQYRPDKHWTLGATWWYMFDKKGTKYPSWSHSPVNPSVSERYIKDNGNMITLTAVYTTDFGSIFKRNVNRSLNNRDGESTLMEN